MMMGSPGEGHGSSASWVWYQSGSIHTSASHSNDSASSAGPFCTLDAGDRRVLHTRRVLGGVELPGVPGLPSVPDALRRLRSSGRLAGSPGAWRRS